MNLIELAPCGLTSGTSSGAYGHEFLAWRNIDFDIQEVVNKSVKGMDADTFLEICRGYVLAWRGRRSAERNRIRYVFGAYYETCAPSCFPAP